MPTTNIYNLSCVTLTVDVSHLPVRNVHLLVIPWRKRKCYHIAASKNPVSVCLHHLQEDKYWHRYRIIDKKVNIRPP